ncbi:GntR family transcriptional regulator [Heyndrickxia acidicola]|uniref:GntR family transcriptional regulator n=1 Tax=Heyndrickxia acidicola TaxID=209389 RepID=A0ABU6MIB1_9BACI|nr:GntR family transcriptional regulator [Heyndrickxia acidicola]MED1204409.1 GntR family transcriptional regulator [Heyndrickxia acidicola]
METKKSMEQVVYNTLTNAIISRRLAPGTQLIETTIAEQLKVSRTPVRNAIRKLEQEGFVNVIPNKGAYVIQPSIEEMVQAFTIRQELELIAVKEGFHKVTEEQVREMDRLAKVEEAFFENITLQDYNRANREFHSTLAKASGNRFLIEFLNKILSQIDIYLLIYDAFHHFEQGSSHEWADHSALVEAVKQNDQNLFEERLINHLQYSLEELKVDIINYQPLQNLF